MRAFTIGLPLIVIVASQVAYAQDVEYNHSITHVSEFTEQNLSKPFSEVVKDRVWDAKGIEERVSIVDRIVTDLPVRHPRLRIEHSPGITHVSYSIDCSDPEIRAPGWIDDGLWPRTKEVLHYGIEPRPSPPEPSAAFSSGFVGLQR